MMMMVMMIKAVNFVVSGSRFLLMLLFICFVFGWGVGSGVEVGVCGCRILHHNQCIHAQDIPKGRETHRQQQKRHKLFIGWYSIFQKQGRSLSPGWGLSNSLGIPQYFR